MAMAITSDLLSIKGERRTADRAKDQQYLTL